MRVLPLNTGSVNGSSASRQRNVSSQNEELAALEARLRETEERLARVARTSDPSNNHNMHRKPLSDASSDQSPRDVYQQAGAGAESQLRNGPLPSKAPTSRDTSVSVERTRPPSSHTRPQYGRAESSRMPYVPGAMSETPTPRQYIGRDYVTVDRTRQGCSEPQGPIVGQQVKTQRSHHGLGI